MVGYTSHLIADLANDVGVVVLANLSGGIRAASLLAEQIHNVALGSGLEAAVAGLSRSHITEHDVPSGRFGTSTKLTVTAGPSATIEYAGVEVGLLRTGYGTFAADHPSFRHAYLRAERYGETDVWVYGPFAFPRENNTTPDSEFDSISAEHAALEGAYRSYSPWYPCLEVYSRFATLNVAIGVDEMELTRLEESVYRPKLAAAAAERFVFGPIIDGHTVWVEWDGLRFSRRFDRPPFWLD